MGHAGLVRWHIDVAGVRAILRGGDDGHVPEVAPEKPKAAKKATGRALAAKGAPAKGKATKKATVAKAAPKGKKAAKAPEASAPREGSKTAQVVAMLQRKNGASITEIMKTMGWQRHTVHVYFARKW